MDTSVNKLVAAAKESAESCVEAAPTTAVNTGVPATIAVVPLTVKQTSADVPGETPAAKARAVVLSVVAAAAAAGVVKVVDAEVEARPAQATAFEARIVNVPVVPSGAKKPAGAVKVATVVEEDLVPIA